MFEKSDQGTLSNKLDKFPLGEILSTLFNAFHNPPDKAWVDPGGKPMTCALSYEQVIFLLQGNKLIRQSATRKDTWCWKRNAKSRLRLALN